MPALKMVSLESNLLTDLSIPFFMKYLQCRSKLLECLNLSGNLFTEKIIALIHSGAAINIKLNRNMIKPQKLLKIQESDQSVLCISLSLGQQQV
jgi:hypothetical protein